MPAATSRNGPSGVGTATGAQGGQTVPFGPVVQVHDGELAPELEVRAISPTTTSANAGA